MKWKLVPVEPTPEMVDAAWDSKGADYVGWAKYIHRASDAYSAMLEAAPHPPKLSDERIFELFLEKAVDKGTAGIYAFARAIEREILGEKA